MLTGLVNRSFPTRIQTGDGASVGLYPRAFVRNESDQLVATLDLVHVTGGLFSAAFIPAATGIYSIVYEIFTDAAHTVPSAYQRESEQITVTEVPIIAARPEPWPKAINNGPTGGWGGGAR